jgi:hypothetical protein
MPTGKVKQRILRYIRTIFPNAYSPVTRRRLEYDLRCEWLREIAASPNPLLRAGAKYFSQFDEDGILLEILRRLDLDAGSFIEIGVGDGTENNTLILLARGWSGRWLGGETLTWVPSGKRLKFRQAFVTQENVRDLLSGAPCDVLSIDIDGNDYWIAQVLLGHMAPRVVIVEYNAKFPPPVSFVMPYDAAHQWDGSDYFGASLAAWSELLGRHGYVPVCCSYMGSNAFFVRAAEREQFADVSLDLTSLYRPALYVAPFTLGHPTSSKTLAQMER